MANLRNFRQQNKDGKEITRYMLDYVDRSGNRRRLQLPNGTTGKDASLAKLRVEEYYEQTKGNRYRPIMTLEEAHNRYSSKHSYKSRAGHANLNRQSHVTSTVRGLTCKVLLSSHQQPSTLLSIDLSKSKFWEYQMIHIFSCLISREE